MIGFNIHFITKIEASGAERLSSGTYANTLTITDDKGNKTDITFYSESKAVINCFK